MTKQYPKELKERAVRLVLETRDRYKTESAAIRSIGAKPGRLQVPVSCGWFGHDRLGCIAVQTRAS